MGMNPLLAIAAAVQIENNSDKFHVGLLLLHFYLILGCLTPAGMQSFMVWPLIFINGFESIKQSWCICHSHGRRIMAQLSLASFLCLELALDLKTKGNIQGHGSEKVSEIFSHLSLPVVQKRHFWAANSSVQGSD